MRVAALYDIHGNLPALEAVLAEIQRHHVDRIVVGGDSIWGPFPSETVDVLRDLGDGALIIRGNSEREVVDRLDLSGRLPPELVPPVRWTAETLRDDQREFVGGLPKGCTLELDELGPTLFCHATPRSDEELITQETPDDVLREIFAPVEEDIVACGHIHMQYDRITSGRRIVNAGSVGMPYEREPGAYWALLGPSVELQRTPYDVERAAASIRATGFPLAAFAEILLSPPPQEEVIADFERQRETRHVRRV
jgi:predicted phosphodiesterase